MKIILLGPTGTGKGTQAKFISKLLRLNHIETGAIFRKESEKNILIKRLLKQGGLIPDKITINIVNKKINNKKKIILDGFPRTLKQAKALKFRPDLVLFIKTSKKNLVKRLLLRKREDDTKKNIETRYKIYLKKTIPVINYYRKMNVLKEINGNLSIKEVSRNIKKILISIGKG